MPAVTVAVFASCPQLADVVALVTCTEALPLAASVPNGQFSVLPLSVQLPFAGLMLQLTPAGEGRGSFRVTPVAVPAPVFCTVSVYPIELPAETVAASAVFVTFSDGHCTVIVALAVA